VVLVVRAGEQEEETVQEVGVVTVALHDNQEENSSLRR